MLEVCFLICMNLNQGRKVQFSGCLDAYMRLQAESTHYQVRSMY
jgi:hypothetical protein